MNTKRNTRDTSKGVPICNKIFTFPLMDYRIVKSHSRINETSLKRDTIIHLFNRSWNTHFINLYVAECYFLLLNGKVLINDIFYHFQSYY